MDFRATALISWVCLMATSAIAGEEFRTRIEIEVDDDASGQQAFSFDSQDAGFDLDSMAIGETRTLTDRTGNMADIRRTVDGFEFDVGGKTIELDDLHEADGLHGEHEIVMHVDQTDADAAAVKKVKKFEMIKTTDADGVTIISSGEIDAATRERIREALRSGDQKSEVLFIDGSELDTHSDSQAHSKHEIHIIKKEVDVTN